MGNVVDYIKEFGKLSLDDKAFNEVDSLILAQFSYLKFDSLLACLPDNEKAICVRDIPDCEKYDDLFLDERYEKNNRLLLEAMAESQRFGSMRIFNYENIVDGQWEIQFSAVTCVFDNGFVYVAFRGTDDSLIGWKEDFNMAYITPVPAQTTSVVYLNRVAAGFNGKFVVGGHSKGGNLAVYSAVNCLPQIQDRIEAIYSHDGPGFMSDILESEQFAKVKDRIRKTVPRSSIVGMLLQTQENYKVVKCKNVGILQHDPFNWIINEDDFIISDEIHKSVDMRNKSLNTWVENMDYEKRQEFVEVLFELIKGSGAENLNDFVNDFSKCSKGILNTISTMDEKDREFMIGLMKELSACMNENVHEYVSEQIEENKSKYKKKIDSGAQWFSNYMDNLISAVEGMRK